MRYIPIGVRDCIVPRPGHVFYSDDFVGGELVTFAESAVLRVGFSKMGEALNAGLDVHSDIGAEILGITYEQFYHQLKKEKSKRNKDVRQAVKPIIFGAGGMIGPVKIVLQQRRQGPDTEWPNGPSDLGGGKRGFKGLRFCLLMGKANWCGEQKVTQWGKPGWERPCPPTCRACIEAASSIRDNVFRKYTEYPVYLKWHGDNADAGKPVAQHYSGRIRGGLTGPSEANGDFQALLADIAKRSLIRVSWEQYVGNLTSDSAFGKRGERSPLYGSRGVVFVHDELFGECREEVGHEVATRVGEVMIEEFRKGCPHHSKACKIEPAIMRRWFKAAEPVYVNGRLVPWEPQ